jgi:hypothetical protein
MGLRSTGKRGRPRRTKNIAEQRSLAYRLASTEGRAFIEEAARIEFPGMKKPVPTFLRNRRLKETW